MKKKYALLLTTLLVIILISCSKSDQEEYIDLPQVSVNLATVPYPKLSDYHFFEGEIKAQNPTSGVIPYEPASSLFSDYAHKKRFIWLPSNTHATYNGDANVFEFPIGTAIIKTFYYDHVQPSNTTKRVETRLLIRKSTGWQAYTYVWKEDQTDADGTTKNVNYAVPSQTECVTCHKINPNHTGEITIPIGPKPQNLNTTFNYTSGAENQITKWKNLGILGNDVPALASIHSTVDWKDTSKSLELRARSYIDINCAHCHRDGGHCDYTPQRFNFSNTNLSTFGVCLTPLFNVPNNPFVINGGDANHSELIYRISSTEASEMMPIIGRTLVHQEGGQLMKDWINSLPANCH